MKKIIVLLLITVMAVGLMAGCGSQEAGGEKGTVYVYCFGDYLTLSWNISLRKRPAMMW